MEYKPLSRMFHESASSSRFDELDVQAQLRRDADSSFKTGIQTSHGELFLAVPREMTVLNEKILRLERLVSTLMHSLPPIAQAALVRSLVIDEVVCTNDLEGVHSTRRQIRQILDNLNSRHAKRRRDRFFELTKLYLELSDSEQAYPIKPEDVRVVYDRIMQGELTDEDIPDGKFFRAKGVNIIGNGERILHSGLEPEDRIIEAMQKMLDFTASKEVPELYSAIASHYIFEYIHPFYDGNGRTGRYLLALFLSEPLSLITSLSLSRIIAENRSVYYRAFKEAQDPLNRGELTFFVMRIMEMVREAQGAILEELKEKISQMRHAQEGIDRLTKNGNLDKKGAEIVFLLVQDKLFGLYGDASLEEIAGFLDLGTQMTRKHLKTLEDCGMVAVTSKRPLRFTLSRKAWDSLGLE